MTRFPILLKRSYYPAFQRRAPLSSEVKKIIKALLVTLLIIIVGSSVFFLFSRSESAQKGYLLRSIELQNAKLRSENQAMNQKVLEAQSYKEIQESETIENMEPVTGTKYIKE